MMNNTPKVTVIRVSASGNVSEIYSSRDDAPTAPTDSEVENEQACDCPACSSVKTEPSEENTGSGNNLPVEDSNEDPIVEPLRRALSTSGARRLSRFDQPRRNAYSRQMRNGDDDISLAAAIIESRRIAEVNKERRHRENMEYKERLMEKLDMLIEKL